MKRRRRSRKKTRSNFDSARLERRGRECPPVPPLTRIRCFQDLLLFLRLLHCRRFLHYRRSRSDATTASLDGTCGGGGGTVVVVDDWAVVATVDAFAAAAAVFVVARSAVVRT